jgi:hypothetical protein
LGFLHHFNIRSSELFAGGLEIGSYIKEDEGLLITTDLPLNSQLRWARDTNFIVFFNKRMRWL